MNLYLNKRTLPFLANESLRHVGDGFAISETMPTFISRKSNMWFHNCLSEMNLPDSVYESAILTNSIYRVQTILWGAKRALRIEGDFIDFGVWHGILPYVINKSINLSKYNKSYYLFDTWGAGWEDQRDPFIQNSAPRYNEDIYEDVRSRFSSFSCTKFVRGLLPGTAIKALSKIDKIAYVCIDVNSDGLLERELLEIVWSKLSKGSMIFFDDYGYRKYPDIPKEINSFLSDKSESIFELANGTAFILKE